MAKLTLGTTLYKDYSNCISYQLSSDKYLPRYYVVNAIKYECFINQYKTFDLKETNEDKKFGTLNAAQEYAAEIYSKYYDKFNSDLSVIITDELIKP